MRGRVSSLLLGATLCAGLSGVPHLSRAASVEMGGGLRVTVPVKSMRAMRDEGVVRQSLDYSCGSAALATLLSYDLGDAVTERQLLVDVLDGLPDREGALIKQQGLSLLDLKRVAEARGHRAEGYRVTPEILTRLTQPVIVFVRPRGYDHFVLLKGVRGGRVYVADPALGNVRMAAYRFLDMWLDEDGKGVLFVVQRADGAATPRQPFELMGSGPAQPEILSARQLLEVGDPYVRFPELFR